ncbi:MAG: magnesium/cobalt transporter CorA [Actinomycetota bacterium]|nr:magnesium/cobalt transporter CorA [Actinomycetota bacterium]
MIADCALYRDGRRVDDERHRHDLRAACDAVRDGSDFVWLGLVEPSVAEMSDVADALGLHALAAEDAVKAHQRPKIEHYGDGWFLVLKTLWYVDASDAVETGELHVFLGPHHLVTVRHGEGVDLSATRARAEQAAETLGSGPAAALHAVCDAVVDQYEGVAASLEEDVTEVERSVFSPERTRDSERIYGLKRELLQARRAVLPLKEPLSRLVTDAGPALGDDAAPYFRDVLDHLIRVADVVDSVDRLLDAALDAHLARISVQQNDDMRRISAVAALFLAPTLVAGVYGMNFQNLPELGWRYGYPFSLGLMVLVVAVLWWRFKRSGWL